jgi:hypothetical protein
MYKYEEGSLAYLDIDKVLAGINQLELMEELLGISITPFQRICNPLRKWDTFPGAWFEFRGNKLMLIDFADDKTHKDVVHVLGETTGMCFREALNYLYEIGDNKIGLEKSNPIFVAPKKEVEKVKKEINFKRRKFQERDRKFWGKYGITKKQLIEDGVYPIIWFTVIENGEKLYTVRPRDIMYAITVGNKVKNI